MFMRKMNVNHVNHGILMLTSFHLHKKSSEVSIKTTSTPASLSIQARTLSTQL